MKTMTRTVVALAAIALVSACAGSDGSTGGGTDKDTSTAKDTSTTKDTTTQDSGSSSGAADAGSSSGAATDTGSSSGASKDAGSSSGAATDTASSSGTTTDAGSTSGTTTDAGSSSGTTTDAGSSSATTTDAGSSSATTTDAGSSSATTTDAGSSSGATDTGSSSGADAGSGACKTGQFKDPTDLTCKDATCPNMSKALHGAISGLVASSNDCKEHTDCEIAATGTACQGTCGAAINKQALMGFKGKLAAIDQAVCKATGYAGKCGYSTPSCLAPTPGCVKGKCVYTKPATSGCKGTQPANTVCDKDKWVCKKGFFKLPGGGGCKDPTCKAVQGAINGDLGEALAVSRKCTMDKECVTVGVGHACWGACPAAVNSKHKGTIEALVQGYDKLCKDVGYAKKCGYMTPKCIAPNPGCKNGMCVYAK